MAASNSTSRARSLTAEWPATSAGVRHMVQVTTIATTKSSSTCRNNIRRACDLLWRLFEEAMFAIEKFRSIVDGRGDARNYPASNMLCHERTHAALGFLN
jgi:hypothetical protein